MTPKAEGAWSRVRVAALLLIIGLAAGPLSTHVYWMLGGTWGLYTRGVRDDVATTGTRVVAAVVVLLLVAAVLVNLIANALRYSPPEFAPIVSASSFADRLELRVIDRGPGIPANDLA